MELKGVHVAVGGYGARQRMRQRRTACAALQDCAEPQEYYGCGAYTVLRADLYESHAALSTRTRKQK